MLSISAITSYKTFPAYAQPFVERLLQAIRHLPQFPHSGRAMPEA